MKIKEYVIVQNKYYHPELEVENEYEWNGKQSDMPYTDCVHQMLKEVFRMDRLGTERSYVLAFDHKKHLKGICKIGQGDMNSSPLPLNSALTFLLLTGAHAFIITHNHVSNIPEPSEEDKIITSQFTIFSSALKMEFIGHMIINHNGYVIDGGVMNNTFVDDDKNIEYLENGMAATYIFGQRIEGTVDEIEAIRKGEGRNLNERKSRA